MSYFWCIVPMCENTSIKTPEKTFIQVPRNEKRRKLWLDTVRRNPTEFSKTSCVFVCEDHFDLENDMENYMKWKMMGGPKHMKSDIVPHKFQCQEKRKFSEKVPGKGAEKKRKLQEIQDTLNLPDVNEFLEILHKETVAVSTCEISAEELWEGPQAESHKKDVAVTAKPYYLNKYTQTNQDIVCRSCSPILCSS